MKKLILLLINIYIIFSFKICFSKVQYSKSFSLYFSCIDTVDFDIDNLIIGEISSLVILNDSKFVILDRISSVVIIVDIEARNFKTITIEKEMPGVKLEPLAIVKDPQSGFWVSGGRIYYFKFDENGILKKQYSNVNHYSSDKFCIDSKSNIIIYSTLEPGLFYFDTNTNTVKNFFKLDFPQNRINIIRRWIGGSVVSDKSDNIFIANSIENKIYQYNFVGTLLKTYATQSFNYAPINEDIPADKDGMMTYFMKKQGKLDFDTFSKFYFLNNNNDIVALLIVDRMGHLELFKNDGKVLNKEKIIIPDQIVYAGNNYIYLTSQPEKMDQNGNIKNPIIVKYKYKY